MPTAEELRAICDRDAVAEDFIRNANWTIDHAARLGYTSETLIIPRNMTANEARKVLEQNFPNCQLSWKWWSNCFKVSWKERQWERALTNQWFGWVQKQSTKVA